MRKSIYLSLLLAFALSVQTGCLKSELPVEAHQAGSVLTASVAMESNYKWQIFFNLKENRIVSQNLKTDWDLGFETSVDGYHVVLNTSKVMFTRNMGNVPLSFIIDTVGFDAAKNWDWHSGNLDSTAIGDWRTGSTYLVNRGVDERGKSLGFAKLRVVSVDAEKYVIQYADLVATDSITFEVPKNAAYNFTFVSLNGNGSLVNVEPPKDTWDLEFSQYTFIFIDEVPIQPYLVTGCLLNRYNTKALAKTDTAFAAIDLNYVTGKVLSADINSIGYDWKTFDGNTYTTHPEINYLIQTADGSYYKLHFIDFFNSSGAKGYPKWEYQLL